MSDARRLPIGAEVLPGNRGTHFRVWAPGRERVEVVVESTHSRCSAVLVAEEDGYFSGLLPDVTAGAFYYYRLDNGLLLPDPASRYQPGGPHGPSEVVDPSTFQWSDPDWPGIGMRGQVLYELHVGTFTRAGTWEAARQQMPELAQLGITAIEMMPIADFPGRFGWGYDGVDLFAPTHLYGRPDDLRRFVNDAHAHGIAVVLDVVYNHLGPDGNFLKDFSPSYFSTRYQNDWGDALNFDGEGCEAVREFFEANAAYWITECHMDGLRLDATDTIHDRSPQHILATLTATARRAAGRRSIIILGENEQQNAFLARPPSEDGFGLDALWNDDFHHAAAVALGGKQEAYYTDYGGTPQELISAMKYGFLYQGQHYSWQRKRRGLPTMGLQPDQFILYLENHDQVANSATGARLSRLANISQLRALTALWLLGLSTPMLFQGQEFASSAPFLYFADHRPELAAKVREGRAEFLSQFASLAGRNPSTFDDPASVITFERCKLDFAERQRHQQMYDLHKDLLCLRREDAAFHAQQADAISGAVLTEKAFVLRFFRGQEKDRLLVVNLGPDRKLEICPEPLLAPPQGMQWKVLWSSEDSRYGGRGITNLETTSCWYLPGPAAVVLQPHP
jgi:maltooligosyltrehalose trehalohydrolase